MANPGSADGSNRSDARHPGLRVVKVNWQKPGQTLIQQEQACNLWTKGTRRIIVPNGDRLKETHDACRISSDAETSGLAPTQSFRPAGLVRAYSFAPLSSDSFTDRLLIRAADLVFFLLITTIGRTVKFTADG